MEVLLPKFWESWSVRHRLQFPFGALMEQWLCLQVSLLLSLFANNNIYIGNVNFIYAYPFIIYFRYFVSFTIIDHSVYNHPSYSLHFTSFYNSNRPLSLTALLLLSITMPMNHHTTCNKAQINFQWSYCVPT